MRRCVGSFRLFSTEVFSISVRVHRQSYGGSQLDDLLDTKSDMDSVPGQCVGFFRGRNLFEFSLALCLKAVIV